MEPERYNRRDDGSPATPTLPVAPEDRRRVARAAASKPINVAMLLIGGGFFAITQFWWIIPLSLLTYALLVVLATRDPLFAYKVVGQQGRPSAADGTESPSNLPPERRARWLPRGDTRRTVDEALINYRKLVGSIESSGEVARSVLGDAVPKLHATAERLVDVAHEREKAQEAIHEICSQAGGTPDRELPDRERTPLLRELEGRIKVADEEISGTHDRLLTLRTRMVGASLNSEVENRATASELTRSLEELNFRLEALAETSTDAENLYPANKPPDDERG